MLLLCEKSTTIIKAAWTDCLATRGQKNKKTSWIGFHANVANLNQIWSICPYSGCKFCHHPSLSGSGWILYGCTCAAQKFVSKWTIRSPSAPTGHVPVKKTSWSSKLCNVYLYVPDTVLVKQLDRFYFLPSVKCNRQKSAVTTIQSCYRVL